MLGTAEFNILRLALVLELLAAASLTVGRDEEAPALDGGGCCCCEKRGPEDEVPDGVDGMMDTPDLASCTSFCSKLKSFFSSDSFF